MGTAKAKVVEEKKRLWDNYLVVGEVQKSDKIKFVIGAGVRDGVKYLNIREFYYTKYDSAWKPGRDGITVPIRVPIEKGTKIINPFEEFISTLHDAVGVLDGMALSDINNSVYVEKKVRKANE